MIEQLSRHRFEGKILLYGGERWTPYNRVQLSAFVAGEVEFDDLSTLPQVAQPERLEIRLGVEITEIDRDRRCVIDQEGNEQGYSKLVLALGARPRIPKIEGVELDGVFTFRDLGDAERLIARRLRTRHTVILGGGLLGVEAARAMRRFNTDVTIVEQTPRLMFRQLDSESAGILRAHVEEIGIRVVLDDGVREIRGDGRVEELLLRSGTTLPCDTLIISAGIIPNIELARHSGLNTGRGIRVDDQLRSSDPDIYAVGECAEHQERVLGLAAPGLEQASVAAYHIATGAGRYQGSIWATSLKVVGLPVFSLGATGESEVPANAESYQFLGSEGQIYRRIIAWRDRVIGMIVIGQWDGLGRAQELVARGGRLWPWQLARFERTGSPWPEESCESIQLWPDNATVCNCTGVTRGQLGAAMARGATDVATLAAQTGASSVCGNCRSLLTELVGSGGKRSPEPRSKSLLGVSGIALLVMTLIALLPGIPYSQSVEFSLGWDVLWREGIWKQTTGFLLLGLTLLALLISLRKRIKALRLGDFPLWRLLHVALGVTILALLILHSGLRMGHNLNLWLMLSFTGLIFAGVFAAASVGLEHRLSARLGRRLRHLGNWLHILLFWPLPALLAFHIIKSYYY